MQKLNMKLFILFGLLAAAQSLSDTTSNANMYCNLGQKSGCKSFACIFTQSTNNLCGGTIVSLSTSSILAILNGYRQKLATGYISHFPSAARMIELQWNDELAQVALYNVKQCIFQNDNCLVTKQFPSPGQIIGYATSTLSKIDSQQTIIKKLDEWFTEYKNCVSKISKSPSGVSSVWKCQSNGNTITDFTQIIQESVTHVGCAAIQYAEGVKTKSQNVYIVCNFSTGNNATQEYLIGSAGSQCSVKSKTYLGLCQS